MNKILGFTILFFLLVPELYSQLEEKEHILEIHTVPSTMFDFTPHFRLGLEYQGSSKFAYILDLGVGNSFSRWIRSGDEDTNKNYQFWEIRPEVKYYFHKPNDVFSMYCSTELFYINASSTISDSYYYSKHSTSDISYDRAHFEKQKIGGHLKIGVRLIANNKYSFDFYVGPGIAHRTVNYSDVVNPTVSEYDDHNWSWDWPVKREGNTTIFHLAAGFKIGCIF